MTAEPSTQQRPWAAVAPWPADNDPLKVRLHFAAMSIAFWRTYDEKTGADDILMTSSFAGLAARAATERYLRPAMAAFTAAALAIVGDHTFTLQQVQYALEAGIAPGEAARWLEAAGINPAEIQAAV